MEILKLFKSKKKEKPTKFILSCTEVATVGDKYSYDIKAETQEEAFRKLVQYFYGSQSYLLGKDVQQDHYNVSVPSGAKMTFKGMPSWFGRVISAKGKPSDYKKLEEYMEKYNIKKKKRWKKII